MPALSRLDLGENQLTGPVPTTFRNHPTLAFLSVDSNPGLAGDLVGLAGTNLQVVAVSPNPGLCGPVPESVRFAVGYNATGTSLGKPCPAGGGGNHSAEPSAAERGGGGAPAAAGAPAQVPVAAPPAPAPAPQKPAVVAQQGPAPPS
jgi:hypothetical protein